MPGSGLRWRPLPPGHLDDRERVRKVPTPQMKRQRSRVGSWPSPQPEARLGAASRQVLWSPRWQDVRRKSEGLLALSHLYMRPEAAPKPLCSAGLGPETAWSVVGSRGGLVQGQRRGGRVGARGQWLLPPAACFPPS